MGCGRSYPHRVRTPRLECSTHKDTGATSPKTTVVWVSRFSEILHKAQAGPLGEARPVGKGRGGVVTLHGCVRESISTVGTLSTIYTSEVAIRFRFCGQILGNSGKFQRTARWANNHCAPSTLMCSWMAETVIEGPGARAYVQSTRARFVSLRPVSRAGNNIPSLPSRQLQTARRHALATARAHAEP